MIASKADALAEIGRLSQENERLIFEVTGLCGLVRAVASETNIPMEEVEQSIDTIKGRSD